MKILITNDDGIHSYGIQALSAAMKQLAEIAVVAPDRDRSAASNSLTITRPLLVHFITADQASIAVQGTPTDCVHLAITGLLDVKPDMVVSGINRGPNLGDDVLYSGTVAAAMEGRFLGLPAIAFSQLGDNTEHLATAAHVAKQLVTATQQQPLPQSTILNVNIPNVPIAELAGYEVTRLGKRHSSEQTVKDEDPRGNTLYWIGPPGPEQDAGPGTDFFAVRNNKVSITPLSLDLTDYSSFGTVSEWVNAFS